MDIFKPTELNFSDKAIEHFTKSLDKRGNGLGIQIGVRKAGCSGYEYFFDFVDEINLDHKIFEKNNISVAKNDVGIDGIINKVGIYDITINLKNNVKLKKKLSIIKES